MMEGVIKNYRRGRNTLTTNQFVIILDDITTRSKASSLTGKTVTWTSEGGRKIFGRISAAHGDKGAVRARFVKGLPGQAIGTVVEIVDKAAGKAPKAAPVKAVAKKQ